MLIFFVVLKISVEIFFRSMYKTPVFQNIPSFFIFVYVSAMCTVYVSSASGKVENGKWESEGNIHLRY